MKLTTTRCWIENTPLRVTSRAVAPMGRLLTTTPVETTIFEKRVAKQLAPAAIDREIGVALRGPVKRSFATVAEKIELAHHDEILEQAGIRIGAVWRCESIIAVHAAYEPKRVANLMDRNADEIERVGVNTVSRIEIERERIAERDRSVTAAVIDSIPVNVGSDAERLRTCLGDRQRGVIHAAIIVDTRRGISVPATVGLDRVRNSSDRTEGRIQCTEACALQIGGSLRIQRARHITKQRRVALVNRQQSAAAARGTEDTGVERTEAYVEIDHGVIGQHRRPVRSRNIKAGTRLRAHTGAACIVQYESDGVGGRGSPEKRKRSTCC